MRFFSTIQSRNRGQYRQGRDGASLTDEQCKGQLQLEQASDIQLVVLSERIWSMSYKSLETSLSKKVFLIGNKLTQEGITTKITSLGHSYEIRSPYSTPSNWMKIKYDLNELNKMP